MNQDKLYVKFLELANYLENLYRNSDLDISDIQFEFAKNKILNHAYILGLGCRKFSETKLKDYERIYNEYKVKINQKRI